MCVWFVKLSYYFQASFCEKQVIFSFTHLLFSSESKLPVSPESLILSVLLAGTQDNYKGSFSLQLLPLF